MVSVHASLTLATQKYPSVRSQNAWGVLAFSPGDARGMHFQAPFSCHAPAGAEGRAAACCCGECLLCAALLLLHGLLRAHHLLSAFPAIKSGTAGKLPLVHIQSFPADCCMLRTSIVLWVEHLFLSPPKGNWAVMCGEA